MADLISPVARRVLERRFRGLEEAGRHAVACQRRTLSGLLARGTDTEFGRRYGFRDITTAEQYRARVPLASYETSFPLWERAAKGEPDVTWPGRIEYFGITAGTTAGNKYIPLSSDAIRANRRAGADLLAIMLRRGGGRNFRIGKFLYFGLSSTLEPFHKAGAGFITGVMSRLVPWYARPFHLPERAITDIGDWEEKNRAVVQRYFETDIWTVAALPFWSALMFKALMDEAERRGNGCRSVGEIWRGLSYIVSFGTALAPYRRTLQEYAGRPVHLVETYSSTEAGVTAIQEEEGGPLRLVVDNGVFFEFVEAARKDERNPPRLHLGELRVGQQYALVVTTNSGLWAYPLGDVVRVESLDPPCVSFSTRTKQNLSAFGRHIALETLDESVAEACVATNASLIDYTVCTREPSPAEPHPQLACFFEFETPPADRSAFAAAFDRAVQVRDELYRAMRQKDYAVGPPMMHVVGRGTFREWMRQRGKLGGQFKVPHITTWDEGLNRILPISAQYRG